ncbi:16S rRNA (guanine(527)-N(7))-methyltransferase RsmG [Iningainema sp. BLCCT55]|uniref:Ribosomal RNA small subunit methyltransferase G n=2 Tax=Iningainema TaxID=1932705 RepID=A0A8J6XQX6_9CYAN|nr:16S rRNA (guanine(527)-N(7))-methyltransferase RsmG [Iningainema tapete BLCC-T55]
MLPSLPQMNEIWQQTLNWQPTQKQQEQFQRFYELILDGNRQMNLTRITEPVEFWEKHLWDSLRGVALLFCSADGETFQRNVSTVIDIGTGAGIPGIPLAIAVTDSVVTLLDSTRKKINFIDTILTRLELDNVKTITSRAEEIGQDPQHRQTYDLALVRAVGTVTVCAEYALPLLKQNGLAVIYRGNCTKEETTSLENAVQQLGGAVESIEQFTTPLSQSIRHCIYLRKVATTPAKFPRAAGVPTQKPL